MDLPTLLARTMICRYHCATWFRGAMLKPPYLFIDGDAAHVMFVEHMWLEQFRATMPGIIIQQKLKEAEPAKVAVRPSIFKKGYVPGPTRDLFD